MGYFGYLEFKTLESIPILDSSHVNVGTPLSAFFAAYENYLLEGKLSQEFEWFAKLEQNQITDLRVPVKAMYSNEVDGHTDEILQNWSATDPITFDELRDYLSKEKKWAKVNAMQKSVATLISLLTDIKEDTFFFSHLNTLPALKALLTAINKGKQVGAKEVRILFM